MRIGIDASFISGERSGISVYTSNLIEQYSLIDSRNEYILFPFFYYHFLDNYYEFRPSLPRNIEIFGKMIPPGLMKKIWSTKIIPKRLYLPTVDVFHATTFTIPPRYMYKKLVVTIYDTTFYSHPHYHQEGTVEHCMKATNFAVNNADVILAISENTKNDLIKYFDCPAEKIVVTPLACGERFYNRANTEEKRRMLDKYNITKPFILHLGSLEPRKNTIGLIKAYLLLPRELQEKYDLVIFGGQGWLNNSVIEYIKRHNTKENIKLLGYMNNENLPKLYQAARLFAYPSFYEGFGIPPLEAMASGCPTLTSSVSSLPEVCKEGATYCNPYDVEDISLKMLNLLQKNDSQKTDLAKSIAKKYRWGETARATIKAYTS